MRRFCCRASCFAGRCLGGRPRGSAWLVRAYVGLALIEGTYVEVALSGFDQHHLEVVVEVGQAACDDATA